MKRILAMVLTLCMLAALPLAIPAGAEDEAPVTVYAYQTSAVTTDGKWNVRLVATGNDTTFSNVGFRISVVGDETRAWDKNTSTVYQSILATDADTGSTYEAATAEGLGVAYLYCLTIYDIPAAQTVTLKVTPYATQADGTVVNGKTVDVTVKAEELLTPTVIATSEVHSGSASDVFLDNVKSFTCKPETVTSPNYIDTKLAKATRITRVVTKREADVSSAAGRMNGTKVMGSVDGLNWTLLCTLTKVDTVFRIDNKTAYSYIRLQSPGDGRWWTLSTVLLYGIVSDAEITPITGTLTAVTYDADHTKTDVHGGTPASLWDTSNLSGGIKSYTQKPQTNDPKEPRYIGGAFSTGTVITKIIYHSAASSGSRARGSSFEASVDGKRWFKIATLPSNMADGATVALDVTCLTQFRYIRLSQPSKFYPNYWTVGVAEVYGVQVTE